MRYMNLILASTLVCLPTLTGCGDDAAEAGEGESESGSESGTGDESGTGNEGMEGEGGDGDGDPGDGDGDGDTGDGDTGDGDGDTGDGDGDTGDGDGDTGDGDGDGDGDGMVCVPADDTACAQCTADSCCDEVMACQAEEDCACFTECLDEGNEGPTCAMMCGVNNPMMVAGFVELRMCVANSCMMDCGDNGMP
ncbi:hypothetical protein ENSA5_24810 [Enhygromyxa salina]|uniref:Endo-1,4-beta-xylanase A n=1 Tax=Enhygromyxa salina TaxID=215803 RepID=A0A2S9YAW3_9BACT|nr:hypothetical protein [Enhygromyxa salina]PRQ02245.1 hypothetical protein ENSA5_24810 [Enhygromyxa salina]